MFEDLFLNKDEVVNEPLIERFKRRRQTLREVNLKLKEDFIGIDQIIDTLIDKIEAWYVMPESMRRPAIICLWGMTGIGKTDLIRKLVRYLNFSDRFLEIQMTNKGTVDSSYSNSIQSKIEMSNLEAGKPGILFLDEIQRYRTKNEEGKSIPDIKDQDIWQLLSDGKFAASTKRLQLIELLYSDYMYDWSVTNSKESSEDKADKNNNSKYKRGYQTARRIKKLLKLDDISIDEIMSWSEEEKESRIKEAMNSETIFDSEDYSKLLIFISGNIDEAYTMSDSVFDGDTDADILHEHSKRVNFIFIKKALLRRFYPEQIARFGNNHLVYPSLSRSSYEKIIDVSLQKISDDIKRNRELNLSFSQNVHDFIYRNGVFPTQGVRPVFSTIYSSVENLVPKVIISSIENQLTDILMDYDSKRKSFIAISEGKEIFSVEYPGDVDRIKAKTPMDLRMLFSVHELGHAIVYSHLFGLTPTQIEANSASDLGAFIRIHHSDFSTKNSFLKETKVLLAGYAAEKMIFGEVSSGSGVDLHQATAKIKKMIKRFGMGNHLAVIADHVNGPETDVSANTQNSFNEIEIIDKYLKDCLDEVEEILINHQDLLIELSERLFEEGKMSLEEYAEICGKHNLFVKVASPDFRIFDSYREKFQKFKNSRV